jgi:hypothetical protein
MRAIPILSAVLGALLLSACMGWQSAPVPAPRAAGEPLVLGTARLTTWSGPDEPAGFRERIVLRDVQVRGDSLVGWDGAIPGEPRRVALHRIRVSGLELRRVDRWRTGAVVVLTVVAVYGATAVYLVAMGDV